MTNKIIYRVYPIFEKGTLKEDRHNRPLGLVHATTELEAVENAVAGKWVKRYDDLDGYKGEFRAAS